MGQQIMVIIVVFIHETTIDYQCILSERDFDEFQRIF